jgi:hypothetical protein
MKKLFFALMAGLALWSNAVSAQIDKVDEWKKNLNLEDKDTVAWIYGGQLNLGINQALLHNWAAGGELASAQVSGIFAGFLTRVNHNKLWSNNLDMAYGLSYLYSNSFVPVKLDDRLDFTSKYGIRSNRMKRLYLTGLFNFRTQFTKGYDYKLPNWQKYPISDFLSPAYLTLALGAEYRIGEMFSVFYSPIAAKMTFADSHYTNMYPEGAFGIENGKTFRFELGSYLSARYKVDITKQIFYRTRLDLYSNYLAKDVKDTAGIVVKRDNPGNIDVLFDNFIGIKLGKFISVAVGVTMVYDNDYPYSKTYLTPDGVKIDKNEPAAGLGWWQMKQIMNVGFSYKL